MDYLFFSSSLICLSKRAMTTVISIAENSKTRPGVYGTQSRDQPNKLINLSHKEMNINNRATAKNNLQKMLVSVLTILIPPYNSGLVSGYNSYFFLHYFVKVSNCDNPYCFIIINKPQLCPPGKLRISCYTD